LALENLAVKAFFKWYGQLEDNSYWKNKQASMDDIIRFALFGKNENVDAERLYTRHILFTIFHIDAVSLYKSIDHRSIEDFSLVEVYAKQKIIQTILNRAVRLESGVESEVELSNRYLDEGDIKVVSDEAEVATEVDADADAQEATPMISQLPPLLAPSMSRSAFFQPVQEEKGASRSVKISIEEKAGLPQSQEDHEDKAGQQVSQRPKKCLDNLLERFQCALM
jgi:hypothetical protein